MNLKPSEKRRNSVLLNYSSSNLGIFQPKLFMSSAVKSGMIQAANQRRMVFQKQDLVTCACLPISAAVVTPAAAGVVPPAGYIVIGTSVPFHHPSSSASNKSGSPESLLFSGKGQNHLRLLFSPLTLAPALSFCLYIVPCLAQWFLINSLR